MPSPENTQHTGSPNHGEGDTLEENESGEDSLLYSSSSSKEYIVQNGFFVQADKTTQKMKMKTHLTTKTCMKN